MIQIKNASAEDLKEVEVLEKRIWPEDTRAPLEKFESRMEVFPEGFFVAHNQKEMIGASTSQIISYDGSSGLNSWEEATDNGWIKNTHNTQGNALYVVSVGSISRSGGGSALLQAQKELARKLKLEYVVLGARIPGYDSFCKEQKETTIEEYVKLKREDGELLDPELRFYTRNGLNLKRVMPNYMEEDTESRNYGAIMDLMLKYL
jgi:hypothetical protein